MQYERDKGIESKNRNLQLSENLLTWQKMLIGQENLYCVRAKINMQDKRKCLRDPVIYRFSNIPHSRTNTKYKIYPLYDFACPIVDSIEGVTHAMRTNEYNDRYLLYDWILENTGLRKVELHSFSRLNFVNTVMSKRKLQILVDNNYVNGWDDPRLPTIQGLMRRGLRAEAIKDFMLEHGPSKNTTLMEWDKLWSINAKHIDKTAPRFTAISKENSIIIKIQNFYSIKDYSEKVNLHPKNPSLGQKIIYKTAQIIIEKDDANLLKIGEKITLIKWGNFLIKEISKNEIICEFLPLDQDFKNTKKITWLPNNISNEKHSNLECELIEFDNILSQQKLESDDEFESSINKNSIIKTPAFCESNMKIAKKSDIIQIERRGYFYIEKPYEKKSSLIILHSVPQGKIKPMSIIKPKINIHKIIKGT